MKRSLLWPFLACLLLPLAAAWFVYPVTHLPPGFGVFPPIRIPGAPGFNLGVFMVIGTICAMVTALLIFPRLFGFKPAQPAPPVPKARLPFWFWAGLLTTLFFWWVMWSRITLFGSLVYYAFTPMWWGFILVLDGLTYYRSGGKSLLVSKPKFFAISALVSVFGWYFFEYFNYYVLSNWFYPNGHMAALPHATIVVLYLLAYMTVWPAILEWYTLLTSFPKLVARYARGPAWTLRGDLLLWGGLMLITVTVWFPYPLFWAMWIGPLGVLSGQLARKRIWTPLTAAASGNWSPLLLIALASLCNGLFWEFWNHGSEYPNPFSPIVPPFPTNPNYWIYDVPYVNVIHLYSEMPLLGYFGYLPFGILVWVWLIWSGKLFGFDTSLTDSSLSE
ncbi:MAG: hypothetical protein ACYC43_11050 [Burkholderiales bacterium]